MDARFRDLINRLEPKHHELPSVANRHRAPIHGQHCSRHCCIRGHQAALEGDSFVISHLTTRSTATLASARHRGR
jgi:hypothetical protein